MSLYLSIQSFKCTALLDPALRSVTSKHHPLDCRPTFPIPTSLSSFDHACDRFAIVILSYSSYSTKLPSFTISRYESSFGPRPAFEAARSTCFTSSSGSWVECRAALRSGSFGDGNASRCRPDHEVCEALVYIIPFKLLRSHLPTHSKLLRSSGTELPLPARYFFSSPKNSLGLGSIFSS